MSKPSKKDIRRVIAEAEYWAGCDLKEIPADERRFMPETPDMIKTIEPRGSIDPRSRTFRVIVEDGYGCSHPAITTNNLYVSFSVGRKTPTIKWERAPANMGLEINDHVLLSAAEDAAMGYLRTHDAAFVERYFNSK
jgi:hypothetical protein